MGDWNPCCPSCGHAYCESCEVDTEIVVRPESYSSRVVHKKVEERVGSYETLDPDVHASLLDFDSTTSRESILKQDNQRLQADKQDLDPEMKAQPTVLSGSVSNGLDSSVKSSVSAPQDPVNERRALDNGQDLGIVTGQVLPQPFNASAVFTVPSITVEEYVSPDPMYRVEDEDDRQSIQSAESANTLFSTLSGYTAVEMEGATIELQNVLLKGTALTELYKAAIEDVRIGPERLQRNLVLLLKQMSRDLKGEANKELEKLTSRFVSLKARYVAHCIVEGLYNKQQDRPDGEQSESEPEENEADQVQPIDEDLFEDLAIFRNFILESNAFQSFQTRLTEFIMPKTVQPLKVATTTHDVHPSIKLFTTRYSSLALGHLRDFWSVKKLRVLLVVSGYLEPQLQDGMVRLRWRCVSQTTSPPRLVFYSESKRS